MIATGSTFVFAQDDLFTVVEEMPYFGECAVDEGECFKKNFFPFVAEYLIYPPDRSHGLEKLRVYMGFVVKKDGRVSDIKVAKTSGYEAYDAAAEAVLQKLPTFIPGKQKGKVVDVQYLVPIDFFFEEASFPIQEVVPTLTDEVFTIVEKMPLFGTCEKKEADDRIVSYYKETSKCSVQNIEDHLTQEVAKIRANYPSGYYRTKVQFIIEEDGQLTNTTIKLSSGNEAIDEAALQIVSAMQNWQGGTQRGLPVRVQYVLPVQFK